MPATTPTGWTLSDKGLARTIQRASFVQALALVQAIGQFAEAADHHPDIDIRYRTVHLNLSTHSAGHQVTEKDFALAQKINDLNEDAIRLISDELKSRWAS